MDGRVLGGMATGAEFMFFFGAVWLLLGIYGRRGNPRPLAAWLRIGILLTGLALGASIGMLAARIAHLPSPRLPATADQVAENKEIGYRFGWIFGMETAAVFGVVFVLNAVRRPEHILCVIALIVGLHFLPLASLFGAPLYYGTGALGCAIGILGLFVGNPALRQRLVGLSFGLLLWVTATVIVFRGFALTAK